MSKAPEQLEIDLGNIDVTLPGDIDSLSYTDTIDMSSYITIPSNGYTIASNSVNWSQDYTITGSNLYGSGNAGVTINEKGMEIKEGGDIKIGGKSLTKAIEKIEERLGILHPNPDLEGRWKQLKELRNQYQELEKELLEKEKMWKILKET